MSEFFGGEINSLRLSSQKSYEPQISALERKMQGKLEELDLRIQSEKDSVLKCCTKVFNSLEVKLNDLQSSFHEMKLQIQPFHASAAPWVRQGQHSSDGKQGWGPGLELGMYCTGRTVDNTGATLGSHCITGRHSTSQPSDISLTIPSIHCFPDHQSAFDFRASSSNIPIACHVSNVPITGNSSSCIIQDIHPAFIFRKKTCL